MTAELEQELQAIAEQVRSAVERRNQLIQALSAEGYSLRRLGVLAGLSYSGVRLVLARTARSEL